MWIIPSELTDALRGIGGMLGKSDEGGFPADDEGQWVDAGELRTAFEETALEPPEQALAEARGQAGRASREATEHATPAQRGAAADPAVRRCRAAVRGGACRRAPADGWAFGCATRRRAPSTHPLTRPQRRCMPPTRPSGRHTAVRGRGAHHRGRR